MKHDVPSIVRTAERAAVAIEQAVASFPRRHRYTHGTVLRTRAMDVWESAVKAWRHRDQQARLAELLSERIDGLKLSMQLGRQIGAFRSTGEFHAIYLIVAELGRQCGGWLKKLHAKGPNEVGQQHGAPQCPSILSSPGTAPAVQL